MEHKAPSCPGDSLPSQSHKTMDRDCDISPAVVPGATDRLGARVRMTGIVRHGEWRQDNVKRNRQQQC